MVTEYFCRTRMFDALDSLAANSNISERSVMTIAAGYTDRYSGTYFVDASVKASFLSNR